MVKQILPSLQGFKLTHQASNLLLTHKIKLEGYFAPIESALVSWRFQFF